VLGELVNGTADFRGLGCHDEERALLVFFIEQMEYRGLRILENDGIECLIPAEHNARNRNNHRIESQNDIERIHAGFRRKVNRDEIRAAGGRAGIEAQTDCEAVQKPAEDADQQNILCDDMRGNQIGEHAAEHDHDAGKKREFFADIPETDIHRNEIERQIDGGERERDMQNCCRRALNQNRQPRDAARIQSARADEGFVVQCHEKRRRNHRKQRDEILVPVLFHMRALSF